MKKTVADYPELVAQWDWERNGDLKPENFSYGSNQYVWWQCPIAPDHKWKAQVSKRTSGKGCPFCSGNKVCLSNCLATTHPEIASQWHPTKNGNKKPENYTYGSNKEIWWQCPVVLDHVWKVKITKRTVNINNCPCCCGKKAVISNCLATTHPELAKQWHPTKNGNVTPYNIVAGSNKKAWWIDEKGHEWQAIINSRRQGNNCPYCTNKKICIENCLATTHPELAKQWHPTKNKKNPYEVVAGSDKKAWWIDEKGHEWEAVIESRMKRGCPYCAGRKVCKDNCLTTTHPEIVVQWHPVKNGNKKPENYTRGSNEKVWWQCPISPDHEWEAKINDRTAGCGCPCCSGRKACVDNCLANRFPEISSQWHVFKNKNLTPYDVPSHSNKKVWWIDKKGHEWLSSINNRVQGRDCPYCCGKKVCLDNCLATKYPKIAAQWFYAKNNGTPYDVTSRSHKKVWWQCLVNLDHIWEATINSRITNGCPICNASKGENAIKKILKILNIDFERQQRFKSCKNIVSLPFDFVIKTKSSIKIVEYQGEQHFKPINFFGGQKAFISLQQRDLIKRQWCQSKQIPLLEISYLDFGKIEQLVTDFCTI